MQCLLTLTVLLSAFALYVGESARILVVSTIPTKSRSLQGDAIVNNLLEAGHEVTYITPILMKNPPGNLNQIDISSADVLQPIRKFTNITNMMEGTRSSSLHLFYSIAVYIGHVIHKTSIMHEKIQAFLNDSKQNFDAVIVLYSYNTMNVGFSQVFQCPLIWCTWEPMGRTLQLIDEYTNPAYVPDVMFKEIPPLTFYQRVFRLIQYLHATIVHSIFLNTFDQWGYEEAFGAAAAKRGVKLQRLSEAELSASLMLSNTHVSTSYPYALPQNYKTIGGYHINNNTTPLPQGLKTLMDEAKNGVIYFSMGSNMKSNDFPDVMKQKLLDVFGTLEQTVIWKFEEVLADLPKNVHILQWAPQQSILAHPNCILFISHGGLLSITEAIHFGVPIIGIPGFSDHFANVNNAVAKGYAVGVALNYDLPSNLRVAINEILNNSSYRETAKRLSSLYHDRLVPPAKEMVYWVEHVIRTKGAPHLRSMALMTPWYQKLYLDLIALIVVVIYVMFKLIKLVFPSKKDKLKMN